MTKAYRYVDDQGRVVLPAHIREALNLSKGSVVEVSHENGTQEVRIRPSHERCAVCGLPIEEKPSAQIKTGTGNKLVCYKCAQAIARDMIAQMR